MLKKRAWDFMETSLITVNEKDSIYKAGKLILEKMKRNPGSSEILVVNDKNEPVGYVTLKQILHGFGKIVLGLGERVNEGDWDGVLAIGEHEAKKQPVRQIMRRNIHKVYPNMSFLEVLELVIKKEVPILPVIDEEGFKAEINVGGLFRDIFGVR